MANEPRSEKTSEIEELRKTHPNAYMRWTKEEDQKLTNVYNNLGTVVERDFEIFLLELAESFGRRIGGIRGRLAKYFPAIPGWDYEGQKIRDEERQKLRKEKGNNRPSHSVFNFNEPNTGAIKNKPKSQFSFTDNPEAQNALKIMSESNEHLFLTGEAGTGKSTLLEYFRNSTDKNVVVLAPTGVAALNVEGQTIHSFCAFGPDVTLQKVKKLGAWSAKRKLLNNLSAIIIDEISMVRADLLDCVDKFLRLNGPTATMPFGGLQMIFIGDLYQLPPVEKDFGSDTGLFKEYESPYFFHSRAFKSAKFNFIQLKTAYRQKEQVFLDVLNAVRNNAANSDHLQILNARTQNDGQKFAFEKFAIYLTPTNARARQVNNFFLGKIQSEPKTYLGTAMGSFEDRELPTDLNLQIKTDSQIMMLNNDQKKRWVNGTMGKIVNILKADDKENNSSDVISIELETGETVKVEPHTWEMYQFVLDKQTQKIQSRTKGTFTQYPFKLAWAVTIHKAQGKTFDKVFVDLTTGTFAHGQLYVALSRCRTLNGLHLKRAIKPSDIILDNRIVEFLHSLNPTETYYSTAEREFE
jgi:ATP-dependent DNA helicase PIF1